VIAAALPATGGSWVSTIMWLLPAAVALLVLLLPWSRRWVGTLGVLAAFVEIGVVVYAITQVSIGHGDQLVYYHSWISDIGLGYHVAVDGLTLVLLGLTAFVVPWVLIFALWAGRERLRPYVGLILLLESALMLLFVARDLVLFYVAFEAMLIPFVFLIGLWGGPQRVSATLRFVIYTLVGSLLMLVSIITLGLTNNSFDLTQIGHSNSTWLFLAFMAAFAIKAPLYPLHGWVPDAYRQSSPEVAALLSGVVSKAGTYGMLRFALPIFPQPAADWRNFFIVLGVAGLLWGSLVAFRQTDSRGVIAYSSIAQMSFITLGIFVLNDPGATGAAFQMVNHGLISALLFLLAGFVEVRFGSSVFRRIGALAHGRPALATIVMTTGIIALAVPGSNLFASEFLVLLGSFRRNWLIGSLAAIAIVLAAMYMLRWISAVLHDPPTDPTGITEAAEPAVFHDIRWEAVYLVPLIAALLVLSAQPYIVTHRVQDDVHALTAPAALAAHR
jgi:NADH-quinone oxidoreductase subunit M